MMQTVHEVIKTKLEEYRKQNKLRNYYFTTVIADAVSFSSDSEELGGLYSPVISKNGLVGQLVVEIPNGKVFSVSLDPSWATNFDDNFQKSLLVEYKDDAAKVFLNEPEKITFTKQASDQILNLKDKSNLAVEKVKEYKAWANSLGEKSQGCNFEIGTSNIEFSNSCGSYLKDRMTEVSFYAILGEYVGFGDSLRDLPEVAKEKRYMEFSGQIYRAMKTEFKQAIPKSHPVILDPEIFASLLDHFMLSNLDAVSIYEKRSRFNLEAFQKEEVVAPELFNLTVFPKKELSSGAINFSAVGWEYPEMDEFIRSGRLVKPIASHREANLLGVKPTPMISSLKLVSLGEIEKPKSFAETLAQTYDGIYISQILGLHTQSENKGDFSLVCPYSVVIKNGKMIGSLKVMIRGNFFDLLKSISEIYRDDLSELPYIVTDQIEVIPA